LQSLALFERWRSAAGATETAASETAWRAHLRHCQTCQAEGLSFEALQAAWQALEPLPVPSVSAGFEARLQQRIALREARALQTQQRWQRLDHWVSWLHLPAVAVAMGLFIFVKGTELPQLEQATALRQARSQQVQQWLETPLSDVLRNLQAIYPKPASEQKKQQERKTKDEMV
jgi:hypothetical protein